MANARTVTRILLSLALCGGVAGAQTSDRDASARLREVLPADVAGRVLARIADARAHDLPAQAIENRALKFAAKGVAPREIERSVDEHIVRLTAAHAHLASARGTPPADGEVEAAAEAMRKGVDGARVSALVKEAPSGRSLEVPLYVIGSLIDRGLPSDSALARVAARVASRGTDADIQRLASALPAAPGQARKSGEPGSAVAASLSDGLTPAFGTSDKKPSSGTPATTTPKGGGTSTPPVTPKPLLPPVVKPTKTAPTPGTSSPGVPKQPATTAPTTGKP